MNLNEWKDSNGNKINLSSSPGNTKASSGSSNKDKFVKLMYNMMKNKLPSVTDVKCVRVDDNGFTYKEVRKSLTSGEFTLVLLVGYEKDDSWKSELYMDTKLLETKQGTGMTDLIRYIGQYFSVPDIGTKEYQSLTEWVDSNGKKVNTNSTAPASTPVKKVDQTYRYQRLLAQMDTDGTTYTVNELTSTDLDITVDRPSKPLPIKIVYDSTSDTYTLIMLGKKLAGCKYEEDILELLLIGKIIKGTELCESASSIADDFKTYENLWD